MMIKPFLLICALACTAFGQSVVTAPTGNQTVTQPDGTTFAPSSLGFVLYAGKCPGTDIGMKINSCAAKLPLSGGYHVGTIMLPNTSNDTADATWATTVHLGPGVNLTGQGLLASSFHCTVAGDCLLNDALADGGVYAHTTGATSSMTVTATPASTTQLIAGLHWNTAYVSAAGTVTVPVCNTTAAPITPNITPTFNVRLIP